MYYVEDRSSTCVETIAACPIKRIAIVRYHGGKEYTYSNVPSLAIINLFINGSISLGFWANKIKRLKGVTCKRSGFALFSKSLVGVN
tara:strand:+ start:268 stop:528 length:261 start_codon:yes stop_codon:yes gene_type:complete